MEKEKIYLIEMFSEVKKEKKLIGNLESKDIRRLKNNYLFSSILNKSFHLTRFMLIGFVIYVFFIQQIKIYTLEESKNQINTIEQKELLNEIINLKKEIVVLYEKKNENSEIELSE